MKNLFPTTMRCCAVAFLMLLSLTARAEINPKPFVIPEVQSWIGAEGNLVPSGRLIVSNKALRPLAERFSTDYELLTGRKLTLGSGKAKDGDIVLSLNKKDNILGTEGYRMSVADKVQLTAATREGMIWALQTVLQLSEQSADGSLPKGECADSPTYAWRGFLIDCGRKFVPMSYLKNLVKIMAYYKMNVLHIHLNDNGFKQFFGDDWSKTQSAFRLECETFPGLTAKDGFYTKAEFRELQDLGKEYGVEIIPEIDIPAHSLAFTQYKPEIGSKEYGMDHLDLFNPATYEFVDALLKEYLDGKDPVFSGKWMHIGTDEYSNAKKEVVEKFRYFTDRYIRYVESFGKKAIVWGSLTHARGDTPVKSEDVLMYNWSNGYSNPKDMKRLGYKLVSIPDGYVYSVPAAGYYYDYLPTEFLYNTWTPAQIGGVKFEEGDPDIAGGMFAIWNDHVGNGISVKDIHHRFFPALQTLSAKCWTASKVTFPYAEFNSLRTALSEAPGINELGRLPVDSLHVLHLAPGQRLDGVKEVGYDYTVSFTIEPKAEEKGAILLSSDNATFYLSDPREGKLGFSRDGYLNTFNYRLRPGKKMTITIQGNNRMTRLLVDGKTIQELGIEKVYAYKEGDRMKNAYGEEGQWSPEMYRPTTSMNYVQTLVFPLEKAGKFNSTITDLRVWNSVLPSQALTQIGH